MEAGLEVIRSRQNKAVSELEKLKDRKAREEERSFRFDGMKLAVEALKNEVEITAAFFKESEIGKLKKEILQRSGKDLFAAAEKIYVLEDGLFDRISEEKSPEGVICRAKYIDKCKKIATIYNDAEFSSMKNERIVLMESVRDPSNVGAVIRCAAAMGIDRLIVSRDCADLYHPKTVRASMGTLFNQKIDLADDLPSVIRQLKENRRRVFAAALDKTSRKLGDFEILPTDCVVIGNEGHGLTEETLKACGESVYIPMSDRAESLNAATAAAILMWNFSGKEKH